MNIILAFIQTGSGLFIIYVFAILCLRGFTDFYARPEDAKLPFTQQRIRIDNSGEDADYVPRGQVWAGLFLVSVVAIIWLAFYRYFGLFALQYVKLLAITPSKG